MLTIGLSFKYLKEVSIYKQNCLEIANSNWEWTHYLPNLFSHWYIPTLGTFMQYLLTTSLLLALSLLSLLIKFDWRSLIRFFKVRLTKSFSKTAANAKKWLKKNGLGTYFIKFHRSVVWVTYRKSGKVVDLDDSFANRARGNRERVIL